MFIYPLEKQRRKINNYPHNEDGGILSINSGKIKKLKRFVKNRNEKKVMKTNKFVTEFTMFLVSFNFRSKNVYNSFFLIFNGGSHHI